MEFDTSGCGMGLALVFVCIIIVAGGYLLLTLPTDLADAQADRDYARAAVIEAQTANDAQRQENWEHSFILWTVAMKAFSSDWLLIGTLIALGAAIGYYLHTSGRHGTTEPPPE